MSINIILAITNVRRYCCYTLRHNSHPCLSTASTSVTKTTPTDQCSICLPVPKQNAKVDYHTEREKSRTRIGVNFVIKVGSHDEHEVITGVWGRSPQRGPGAEPLVRGSVEAESILSFTSAMGREFANFCYLVNCSNMLLGRPFVKRFVLCYWTVVCLSVLSVTLVYCSQTVGWINMPLGMEVGLRPGHIV